MAAKKWVKFPHANAQFDYAGVKLGKSWARLHAGDQETFPDKKHVAALQKKYPALKDAGDAETVAAAMQEAWRDFHRGEFQKATEAADALGVIAATIANKAEGIYATYLAKDADRLGHFERCSKRAEGAMEALPDEVNAHYFHAFALGRYSQCISITQALAQGLGGKIKGSLERTLKLAPKHAEAHTAMGLYHAEIIDKIGGLVGGLTYGAKADTGVKHFQESLKLTPQAPIAHIEYGNGLLMMYGKKRTADAMKAYQDAVAIEPADAMEALDIAEAREELED